MSEAINALKSDACVKFISNNWTEYIVSTLLDIFSLYYYYINISRYITIHHVDLPPVAAGPGDGVVSSLLFSSLVWVQFTLNSSMGEICVNQCYRKFACFPFN